MAKPISSKLAQQLILRTLLQLRADLNQAEPHTPQAHKRTLLLEKALARMVGAVGGQQAENTLWSILGTDDRHSLGANLRSQAESSLAPTRRP